MESNPLIQMLLSIPIVIIIIVLLPLANLIFWKLTGNHLTGRDDSLIRRELANKAIRDLPKDREKDLEDEEKENLSNGNP